MEGEVGGEGAASPGAGPGMKRSTAGNDAAPALPRAGAFHSSQ